MRKIPVGQTIGETYGFAFGRYFSVLGVTWFPLLLLACCFSFAFAPVFEQMARLVEESGKNIPPPDFGSFGYIYTWQLAFYPLAIILSVGVVKLALGLRKGPSFIYFAFGMDELRVLGGVLLVLGFTYGYLIVVLGFAAVIGIAAAAAFGASDSAANALAHFGGAGITAIVVAGALLIAGLIYLRVRLGFMLVPITVSERRFGVFRNWEMTKGNVVRIVAIEVVATIIPLITLEVVAMACAAAPILTGIGMFAGHVHAANLPPQILLKIVGGFGLYFSIVLLAVSPLVSGFVLGPSAFAYRALMAEKQGDASIRQD